MATEKRLKGIPYKCDNCIHTASCQRACSIFAYPFLDYMIRSTSCTAYEPKSDAVEVVHGRWEKIIGVITPGGNPMVRCSVCKSRESEHLCYIASTPWHYCPNCGAKMDGDRDG